MDYEQYSEKGKEGKKACNAYVVEGHELEEDHGLSTSQQCAKKAARFALEDSSFKDDELFGRRYDDAQQESHEEDEDEALVPPDPSSQTSIGGVPAPTSMPLARQARLPTARVVQRPFTTNSSKDTKPTRTTAPLSRGLTSSDSSHLDQVQPGAMAVSNMQNGRRRHDDDGLSQSFMEESVRDSILSQSGSSAPRDSTTSDMKDSTLSTKSNMEELLQIPTATPVEAHLVEDEMETVMELQQTKEELQKHADEVNALRAKLQQMEKMQNDIQNIKQKFETTVDAVQVMPEKATSATKTTRSKATDQVAGEKKYSKEERNALSVLLADSSDPPKNKKMDNSDRRKKNNNNNKKDSSSRLTVPSSEAFQIYEEEHKKCCIIL